MKPQYIALGVLILAIIAGVVVWGTKGESPMQGNTKQTYNFSATPANGTKPVDVAFDYGDPTAGHTYTIDFGDGTSGQLSYEEHKMYPPEGQGVQIWHSYTTHHTYNSFGTFTASVREGWSALARQKISVRPLASEDVVFSIPSDVTVTFDNPFAQTSTGSDHYLLHFYPERRAANAAVSGLHVFWNEAGNTGLDNNAGGTYYVWEDGNPSNITLPFMRAGTSWTSPKGINITLEAITATSATFRVTKR